MRWRDLVDRATEENEARDFNSALAVPVRWQPASKIALNALYERNGSGARSNSVEHIQVLEPLAIGRIKRDAKELLCGAKPGSEGLSTGPYWFSKPGDPVWRVTCVACLRIAERLKRLREESAMTLDEILTGMHAGAQLLAQRFNRKNELWL